jgi:hypothetical protein
MAAVGVCCDPRRLPRKRVRAILCPSCVALLEKLEQAHVPIKNAVWRVMLMDIDDWDIAYVRCKICLHSIILLRMRGSAG